MYIVSIDYRIGTVHCRLLEPQLVSFLPFYTLYTLITVQ